MALRGETIYSGAADRCADCGTELTAQVCRSGAGFYIGTQCQCGPYRRESGYFATRAEAEAMLAAHPSEYSRSTQHDTTAPLDLAKLQQHPEMLAASLAAPGNARFERGGDGSARAGGRSAAPRLVCTPSAWQAVGKAHVLHRCWHC